MRSMAWLLLVATLACGGEPEGSSVTSSSGAGASGGHVSSSGGSSTSAGASGGTSAGGYSTNFDGDENPLSESGAFSHVGLDWTVVEKSGGIAYGTQTGTNGYDDSYAILSGFPADHSASAVIHLIDGIDGSCTHEVELLMRWSDADHNAQGYECNVSFDGGYAQIVRWNGPLGDFTPLAGGSYPGLKAGDTFEANIVGNVITAYVNGTQVVQTTDDTFTTGNPGVGFFRRECGSGSDFGFTSFTAR